MKKGFMISVGIVEALFFAFSVVFLFLLAYFFNPILGPGIVGNDAVNYLAFVKWFATYFPHMPFWFPLQGGGVSIINGYPTFPAFLVILVTRVSHLDIVQAFKLVGFLSVPLTSVGIFVLVWSRFKSQAMALVASVLYLVSPIAYVWITQWGFYAEAISYIFVPWTILLYFIFWDGFKNGNLGLKERLGFAGACIGFVLCFISHPSTLGVPIFLVFYTFLEALLRRGVHVLFLKRALIATLLFGSVALLLSAFWWAPFFTYTGIAGRDGLGNVSDVKLIAQGIPSWDAVLSLRTFAVTEQNFVYQNISFPIAVWILVLIGTVTSFFLSRKVFILGLFTLYTLLFGMSADISVFLAKYLPIIGGSPFSWRSLFVPLRIVVPIVGAYGAYGIIHFILRKLLQKENAWFFILRGILVGFLSFALVFAALLLFGNSSHDPSYMLNYKIFRNLKSPPGKPNIHNSGIFLLDLRDIWKARADDPCNANNIKICSSSFLREHFNVQEYIETCASLYQDRVSGKLQSQIVNLDSLCGNTKTVLPAAIADFVPQTETLQKVKTLCETGNQNVFCPTVVQSVWQQLQWKNWPKFVISKDANLPLSEETKRLVSGLEKDTAANPLRVDMSPRLPSLVMGMSVISALSQMQVYTTQLSLIHLLWGVQSNAFYVKDAHYLLPSQVDEMAKWFGIGYTFLEKDSPIDKFAKAQWEKVASSTTDHFELWKFKGQNSMAEISNKPAVLVIADIQKQAYQRFFTMATNGLISYDQAIIMEGKSRYVDDYSLAELKQYKALVLYGYSYKNQQAAWDLLSQYVQDGGRLYIDTGWQYETPDWQIVKTPDFMPLSSLSWQDLGQTKDYVLQHTDSTIHASNFAPLTYGNTSWSVSTGATDSLRDKTTVLLSVKDSPLLVERDFGKGKIVWSGMNFLEHIQAYGNNPDELGLAQQSFAWLLSGLPKANANPVHFTRSDPDSVVFNTQNLGQGGMLYWKESYYPGWTLVAATSQGQQSLEIHRAGPGFMGAFIPVGTTGLLLSYQTPFATRIAQLASVAGLLGVVLFVFVPGLHRKAGEKIKKHVHIKLKAPSFSFLGSEDD